MQNIEHVVDFLMERRRIDLLAFALANGEMSSVIFQLVPEQSESDGAFEEIIAELIYNLPEVPYVKATISDDGEAYALSAFVGDEWVRIAFFTSEDGVEEFITGLNTLLYEIALSRRDVGYFLNLFPQLVCDFGIDFSGSDGAPDVSYMFAPGFQMATVIVENDTAYVNGDIVAALDYDSENRREDWQGLLDLWCNFGYEVIVNG